ncbi:MAG TPA: xanthine dehydrogenase family protein molybdopterin-binding subunit [Stellaceae bacterium]|nr:xanthine dehydrogenase family protein molybdopterin-binding subunit [Stellaceae bacterium]
MSLEPPSGAAADLSRRTILKAATAGGLLLGFRLHPLRARAAVAADNAVFEPNAFIRIGRDGKVTMIMPQVEMGQGTYTSMPMLIAEELEVDLAQVALEAAPPDDRLYANPKLGMQATGGSTSVPAMWLPLRRAGAAARIMLVEAAARRWRADPASCHAQKGEVVHAATGRRASYGALVDIAATLPVPTEVPLKSPNEFLVIGKPVKRLDSPIKVWGEARFGIDATLPGMLIATVAACPVPGGKLKDVDDGAAKNIAGVRQIVRLDDAVAVVADNMWAAKQGLAALDIGWDEGANAKLSTAEIVRQLDAASQHPGVVARKNGDVAQAVQRAATKLEAVYQMPFLAHATMEPMNCTVHVRPDGCDVWVCNQILGRAQAVVAEATGLPRDKVQVRNLFLGGGFGRRLEVDYVAQAARIAKEVAAPVKVIWSREEDIQHDIVRPYYYDRLSAGLDEKGNPVAWTHRVTGSSVMARWYPPGFKNGLDPDAVECAANGFPYAIPNMLVDYVRHEIPGIATGWWRGVGPTHNVFMVESFIDELAAAAKRDPVEYRRALLGELPQSGAGTGAAAEVPWGGPSPQPARFARVLDLAAQKAGWGTSLPAGSGRGVSLQYAMGSYLSQVAQVEVSKQGEVRVERVVCAVDCGIAVNPDTIKAQIAGGVIFGLTAALFSEITFENGRVQQSNFNNYRMLRIDEAPVIDVYLVDSAQPPGGIGEPGTIGAAPALTNAIFAATGKRIRKLPVKNQLSGA